MIYKTNGDDTFGEYGVTNQDCDNCANGKPIQCIVDCGLEKGLKQNGNVGKKSLNGQWSMTI